MTFGHGTALAALSIPFKCVLDKGVDVFQFKPGTMLAAAWPLGGADGSRLTALISVLAVLLFSGLISLVVELRAERRDRRSNRWREAGNPRERKDDTPDRRL